MKNQRISLAHGDGGELAHNLIQDVFVQAFGHNDQARFDSAIIDAPSARLAVTTDSFVVKPIFFPGGNIGKIAIAGTVNDLAVSGAVPMYLTAAFIIEEGFKINDLKEIVRTMASEAEKANVRVIAGDTKVVERGSIDGLYINTTGVGFVDPDRTVNPEHIETGDSIIISGTIGDHGVAILGARGELGIKSDVNSDCAALNGLIDSILKNVDGVRIMRDPTRGGLATTLVEIAEDFQVTMEIVEEQIPIQKQVQGACDILGYDPLYLANEGKVIIIVKKENEAKVLELLKQHELGRDARVIGHITGKGKGHLHLKTGLGSTRRLNRLSGMMLPRIC
ncbi:hydrogenase expression/formation protein HypE [Thermoactinomyces mirandus]|uniref:Hydrogenase expression/formation protein HypE n=1 Tax=Thermoactinomyces mirandus TaxID=2756294 RepID=A0A7W2ARQ5_9BACL|nr:hydrogenase expression/formation protein HypE [Thermoactinomyces mirandus]MBA4601820.1 hydrogenase expression/formation protein HypE [Thermoactinomyces mirandus]